MVKVLSILIITCAIDNVFEYVIRIVPSHRTMSLSCRINVVSLRGYAHLRKESQPGPCHEQRACSLEFGGVELYCTLLWTFQSDVSI